MRSPFALCPGCGSPEISFLAAKELRCRGCGFHYFHNVAAAVGILLRHGDCILFAVRGAEPGRGLLDIPGGFVEPGESLEQGLRREVREELGLELPQLSYLGSCANQYLFDGVLYHTTDAFFEASVPERPRLALSAEITGVRWLRPDNVPPAQIAFSSVRAALRLLPATDCQRSTR